MVKTWKHPTELFNTKSKRNNKHIVEPRTLTPETNKQKNKQHTHTHTCVSRHMQALTLLKPADASVPKAQKQALHKHIKVPQGVYC